MGFLTKINADISMIQREVEKAGYKKEDIHKVAQKADDAFWAVVADSYPEIKTGDLDPTTTGNLRLMMEEAIIIWLNTNNDL
jgi:hypothetical protein